MKYQCEIIRDLLPLYQDQVCSNASKAMVEEHLQECADCKVVAEKLTNYDVDHSLAEEKNSVLRSHKKEETKRTYKAGIITSAVLMIPIVVCFICNLAIGHTLDWFFIVLTSVFVAASIFVVPFLVSRKKALWTVTSFTAALLLLLLVCSLYVGGDWFFIAAVSCIFGLSVFLAPFVVQQLSLPEALSRRKGLLVMAWDTLWLYALIVTSGLYTHWNADAWKTGLLFTTYFGSMVWLLFLIIRYLRKNAAVKSGLSLICVGIYFSLTNDVGNFVTGIHSGAGIFSADISKGFGSNNWDVTNANIMLAILLISVIVGLLLLVIGSVFTSKGGHSAK